jgi:Fic family protein
MNIAIPLSPATLKIVSDLDHFRGSWAGGKLIPTERLERLESTSTVQSIAASCRMAGIRVTETEVAALLDGDSVPFKEGPEVLGYAEAMARPFPAPGAPVAPDEVRRLHTMTMGVLDEDAPLTAWRTEPYHLEVFDAGGQAIGRVIQTLPPRLIDEKMAEITGDLEIDLQKGQNHPILVIGTFMLRFVAICPFSRGNGRVVHLMVRHLLLRAGYDYMPYASFERIFEEMREEYFEALDLSETRLWTDEADLSAWLTFYLRVLQKHKDRLAAKIDLEKRVLDFSPLQRRILETVREHGTVAAGLLLEATGANRNTLKDNLRRLVDKGVLERMGQRRGTRYRLATGDPPTL